MISLDPSERPAFNTLLHTSRGTVFPEFFYSFLHNYVFSVNELSSDVLAINSPPPTIQPTHIVPSMSGSTLRPSPSGGLNPNTGTSIGSPVRLIPVLTITVLTSFVDVEEFVVAKVLSALINLCELGLFQKMRIWEPVSTLWDLSIFIYHPNIWIRQGGRERV